MSMRTKDGFTQRDHYEALRRRGVKVEPPPERPTLYRFFRYHVELSARRQGGSAIGWTDLLSWCTLTGRKLGSRDVKVLTLLEREFFKVLEAHRDA